MREYARARATLLDGFSFPSGKGYAEDYIQQTLLVCSGKQAEIIMADLPESFLSGVYIESDILRDKVPAYTGVNLKRVSKTHLKRITKDTIGEIGNFNTAMSTDLTKQYNTLLTNNELVNQITAYGWTKGTEKRLIDAGFNKEVINLVKKQTTSAKMVEILEMHGIRGGMHPKEVSVLLRPHIRDVFGDGGVLIDNTGKMRERFIVDADGKYKWVKQKVKGTYRATVKTYSETISRTSMVQAHINGRTETLKQSGMVEKYRSIANMTANTCSQCAMMHGQIISPDEGPLYHPNCSCRRAPVWKKETGLMNHTDGFYENQRNEHFWKQHQLKEYNKMLPEGRKLKNHNFLPKDLLKGMPNEGGMQEIRAKMLGQPIPEWSDTKIANTLWEKTSKDGLEHGVVISSKGGRTFIMGDKDSIELPFLEVPYKSYHTHPRFDQPLSGGDFGTMLHTSHLSEQSSSAITKTHIYRISRTEKTTEIGIDMAEYRYVTDTFQEHLETEIMRLRKVMPSLGEKERIREAALFAGKNLAKEYDLKYEVLTR